MRNLRNESDWVDRGLSKEDRVKLSSFGDERQDGGFRVTREHRLYPFKMWIPYEKLVDIGRALIAKEQVQSIAKRHGISRKTVYRFRKKLQLPSPKSWTRGRPLGELTFNGTTKTIRDWAKEIGINPNTLYHRKWRGWSVEKILTQPYQPKFSRYK